MKYSVSGQNCGRYSKPLIAKRPVKTGRLVFFRLLDKPIH
jgi:hypothetical protein